MVTETSTRNEVSKRPIVELHGVGKTFHSDSRTVVHALNRVDLAVYPGEFVTLLGATGCGKTTLLNLVAGIERPDHGDLRVTDQVRLGRNIAYVFQHYTLFPWRTTGANVAFGLQMRGVPRRQRKVTAAELLATYPEQIIGVEGHTDSDPITGRQWRNNHQLSVARAMAVYDVLLGRSRLQAGQLFIVGHGANHPIASNATLEGKRRNRRVELVVYPEKRG